MTSPAIATTRGPAGPQGPPGPAGGTGSYAFVHTQTVAAATWLVEHNLGAYPGGVTVVDTAGNVIDADIAYVDANTIRITSSAPYSGSVYIS